MQSRRGRRRRPRRGERPAAEPDLCGQPLGRAGFSRAWRSVEKHALPARDAPLIQRLPARHLPAQPLKRRFCGMVQHQIGQVTGRDARLCQRPFAFAVGGRWGQLAGLADLDGGRSRDYPTEVPGQHYVLLGLFLLDDLLSGSTKRQLVTLAVCAEEFFQLTASHEVSLARRCPRTLHREQVGAYNHGASARACHLWRAGRRRVPPHGHAPAGGFRGVAAQTPRTAAGVPGGPVPAQHLGWA